MDSGDAQESGWSPGRFLEDAVRDVLTAAETRVDERIGYAALLLASAGAADEADRLVTRWQAITERPVQPLASNSVQARAWAMLFEAGRTRPRWAAELTPLDLDAEERAHTALLGKATEPVPKVLGDSGLTGIVSGLTRNLGPPPRMDPLQAAAAQADASAREGDLPATREALRTWAELAGKRPLPEVAQLAASRPLARLLAAGADPLGLGDTWPEYCTGALLAALAQRHPPARNLTSSADLVAAILRARGTGTPPAPATEADVSEAERRLGTGLPDGYREFLLTCDGLPADVVFPRLLGAGELTAREGAVVLSEPAGQAVLVLAGARVVEWDPVLGTTVHETFGDLLRHHLGLLEAAG
ncbi:SMI1/KNR4 family protein [Amycolatopsis sp. H20-H5]|uniref:SMI1/KNR4 family protein n=1 Tax=Amycolatopsis sp. H20-H5 TaxID=3046309 RepID=UPI002DB685CB|nr:SMI1/KNR4 family protein [Amycolatopsis sp. H20-H5]MEC3982047.1 SMI1/KNR4 family protein [Amycolatopsis sp. H20-H5]